MSYREIITVSIDHELPPEYSSYVRHKVEETLRAELGKAKHKLGDVKVNAWKQTALDCAIWNLAEQIKGTASDAVNERIQ